VEEQMTEMMEITGTIVTVAIRAIIIARTEEVIMEDEMTEEVVMEDEMTATMPIENIAIFKDTI